MKCEACGDVFDIPAASPWNYDMSAAPTMCDVLAILRTPHVFETYIVGVVMMISYDIAYWAHSSELCDCTPIAWATINIPGPDAVAYHHRR
jgi:hypothetical protein